MKTITKIALASMLAGSAAVGTVAVAQTAADDTTTTTVRTEDDRDMGWLGLLGLIGLAGLMRKKHDHVHDTRDPRTASTMR